MLIGFLIDFWSHLGAKIASKTAQDGPNRPQIDHGTPQDASKTAQDENSRDLAKNSRDLAKSKAKNKDITHDPNRTPDFKAECG